MRILRATLALAVAGAVAFPAAAQPQTPSPGILVVSSFKCDWTKLGEIGRLADSLDVPIMQELVNEGKIDAFGTDFHAWADEWNYIRWHVAPSYNAFFEAWTEYGRRMQARHPNAPNILTWCPEHKDAIYTQGPQTTPRPPR